jgi:tetratricopeptide (TPR) repeat protein
LPVGCHRLTQLLIVGLATIISSHAPADENARGSNAAQESQQWLFGGWRGVSTEGGIGHQVPPTIVELQLVGGDEPGTVVGTRKMYRAAASGSVCNRGEINEVVVHGEYDDVTQSVCLFDQRGVATRYVFDAQFIALAGCVDGRAEVAQTGRKLYVPKPTEHRNFRGDTDPFPFSVLWRDSRADHLIADYFAKVNTTRALLPPLRKRSQPRRSAGAQAEISPGNERQPAVEKISEWASPVSNPGDAPDRRRAQLSSSRSARLQANLFEDGYFTSFFDKPYDELSATDLRAIYAQFLAERPPTGSPPVAVRPLRWEYPQLAELFDGPDARVLIGVNWRRAVSHWMTAAEKQLADLPATSEAISHLDFAEATSVAELAILWPEARDKLTAAIAQARSGIPEVSRIATEGREPSETPAALPRTKITKKEAGTEPDTPQKHPISEAAQKEAAAHYERALAQQGKAESSKEPADYNTAIDEYQRCLELDSSNAEAHVRLGDCYRVIGKYDLAQREYDQGIQVSAEAKALLKDSNEKEKTRYCYAAIHDLDKLTEMEPNNAALYFRKANLYLMDHASEQANENFRRASELEPTNLTYGMRAAHPVPPSHQYTTEELKEKLTNGVVGAVVGAFALGAMADHAQEQRVKNLIESSGGRKIRCPKCNGYGQIRTESSEMVSTNPYPELTNEWQKYEESSIFSTKQLRSTTHIADCDRCGGTGVVDK